jgi:hypothetical protein
MFKENWKGNVDDVCEMNLKRKLSAGAKQKKIFNTFF